MKFQKILVTGSSGVTGHAVMRVSRQYPSTEFVFSTSRDCNLGNQHEVFEYIEGIAPDAILHLAAVSGGIGLSMKHQASMLRDNVMMTFSVLEAARRAGVRKTLMTLTTGMYPPAAPLPLREESIHDGEPHDSNYGSSFAKRLIEPAIRSYREEYGLDVIGVVPNGIFGENDNFNYDDAPMLPILIRRFYESRHGDDPIVVWGDGTPLREYTYSEDVAKAFLWCLENYSDGQILNTGTTEELSVREIAFAIADLMKIERNRIVFDTTRPNGVIKKSTDNSRFVGLSGLTYTPFRVGLEKTVNWFVSAYEEHPETLRLYSKSKG